MIFSTLLASALLATSTVVRASPLEARDDKFKSSWLNVLNDAGLKKTCESYDAAFKTSEGDSILSTLKNGGSLTVLAPHDDAWGSDNPLLSPDQLKYNTIFGSIDDGFKTGGGAASRRSPNQNHLKGSTSYPTTGTGGSRKRLANDDNNQSIFLNQFVTDGRKRWEPMVFVERSVGSSQVVKRLTFKEIIILVIENLTEIPGKISDLLCKPLINSAPNGFVKFGGSLQKVGLLDTVDQTAQLTVFAPTDDAFNKLNTDGFSDDEIASILKTHLVAHNLIFAALFPTISKVTTESGKDIEFVPGGGATYVQCGSCKAQVLRSDVLANNGVLHVIDSVLKCD